MACKIMTFDLVKDLPVQGQFIIVYIEKGEVCSDTLRYTPIGLQSRDQYGDWISCDDLATDEESLSQVLGYFTKQLIN